MGVNMTITITGYNALCNLGNNIDDIYKKAIYGNNQCFEYIQNYLPEKPLRAGLIKIDLPLIFDTNFDLRCNKLIIKNLELLEINIEKLYRKYSSDKIGVVCATTNSGVEEFEKSKNPKHYMLSNPALFVMNYLNLKGFYTTVSTACSSGIKAFSLGRDLLNRDICDTVIIICVDILTKVPVFGFDSLEILSYEPSIPFSKNRTGMNIGEACSIFIIEKNTKSGIQIMGIGESSDIYHSTTPDPNGKEAIKAIKIALKDAKIGAENVDYINAHGTGTIANDVMEANAIWNVFQNKVPVSSTKAMTGHCLGAAAGIETALCCKLLENFDGKLYPNVYDEEFDFNLPKINLIKKNNQYQKCNVCMCNSFGFGGTNDIIILGNKHG